MDPQEIRERRQKLGITIAELAERIGVATSIVSRWENGQRKPHQLRVGPLRHALGLDPGNPPGPWVRSGTDGWMLDSPDGLEIVLHRLYGYMADPDRWYGTVRGLAVDCIPLQSRGLDPHDAMAELLDLVEERASAFVMAARAGRAA